MDKMLAEFYALRDFDNNGVPGKAVLEKVGLPDLAALMHDR
jgi:aldehyde:ferredoxin oxidoreductase